MTLFDSHANSNFSENSEVDLIVDLPDTATLLPLTSLKYRLEDTWGLNVDVISRGGLAGSYLEIEREIEIYAA